MSHDLPCAVMIWFGRPIEPRPPAAASNDAAWSILPLHVEELHGLLTGWQKRPEGWRGQVEYQFPVHDYTMMLRFVDWFPAERLRRVD